MLVLISEIKLQIEKYLQKLKTLYMVEHSHVVVNGGQIMVDGIFYISR
jgi:hypothetical protein